MPVRGLPRVPTVLNGTGAFVRPCRKIEIFYCDWTGSSRGLKAFLETRFAAYARSNPDIEFALGVRPGREPLVRGRYVNGRDKTICVGRLEPGEVERKLSILRDASGLKMRRVKRGQFVESLNESTRGVWSPYHDAKHNL